MNIKQVFYYTHHHLFTKTALHKIVNAVKVISVWKYTKPRSYITFTIRNNGVGFKEQMHVWMRDFLSFFFSAVKNNKTMSNV